MHKLTVVCVDERGEVFVERVRAGSAGDAAAGVTERYGDTVHPLIVYKGWPQNLLEP